MTWRHESSTNLVALWSIVANGAIVVIGQFAYKWQINAGQKAEDMRHVNASKRDACVKMIESIEEYIEAHEAGDVTRMLKADKGINNAMAIIDLLGSKRLYTKVSDVDSYKELPRFDKRRDDYLDELYTMMREELGTPDSTYKRDPKRPL